MTSVFKKIQQDIDAKIHKTKEFLSHEKEWHNLSGSVHLTTEKIFHPRTVDDCKRVVRKAAKHSKHIRVAASGHAFSSLCSTKDYLIITNNLTKITISAHEKHGYVVIAEAGAKLANIEKALSEHNPPLMLKTGGLFKEQTIGGAVSVGATGMQVGNASISDEVVALKVVAADEQVIELTEEKDPLEMNAARLSLGLFGIIHTVTLRTRPLQRALLIDSVLPLSTTLTEANISSLLSHKEALELVYFPFNSSTFTVADDVIWVRSLVKTDENPSNEKAEDTLWGNYNVKFNEPLFKYIVNNPSATPHLVNLLFKAGVKEKKIVVSGGEAYSLNGAIDKVQYVGVEFVIKLRNGYKPVVDALNEVVSKIYERAQKDEFPINLPIKIRFVKASQALLSPLYDSNSSTVFAIIELMSIRDTKGYQDFVDSISQTWAKKYETRTTWSSYWERIPEVFPQTRTSLDDRRNQFNKIRTKYDPNGMFFDNESLKRVLLGAGDDADLDK
ncbi:7946_t:CDS:2 [Paraglomus brasilianum]|uniref:D-arabinono-1,4-lactone oxidase n=1 Tax=Paraglomus brasilianum TaxID=144538 RepID=A0A9N8ZZR1_9GLOM|nr:7946_t:CDS:2 [Paraglomus brasilianum]